MLTEVVLWVAALEKEDLHLAARDVEVEADGRASPTRVQVRLVGGLRGRPLLPEKTERARRGQLCFP